VADERAIAGAREAAAAERWSEAYEAFAAAEPESGADLEAYAEAAWWASELRPSLEIRHRAYAAYVAEGDEYHAAAVAARVAIEHFIRDEPSVGAGFLMRAKRHAEAVPDGREHGYIAMVEATVARLTGSVESARIA